VKSIFYLQLTPQISFHIRFYYHARELHRHSWSHEVNETRPLGFGTNEEIRPLDDGVMESQAGRSRKGAGGVKVDWLDLKTEEVSKGQEG